MVKAIVELSPSTQEEIKLAWMADREDILFILDSAVRSLGYTQDREHEAYHLTIDTRATVKDLNKILGDYVATFDDYKLAQRFLTDFGFQKEDIRWAWRQTVYLNDSQELLNHLEDIYNTSRKIVLGIDPKENLL